MIEHSLMEYLKKLTQKFCITNKILPKKQYYTSIYNNRHNNPYEKPFNNNVVHFYNNAYENSKSVYDDPKLTKISTFDSCSTL